MALESTQPSTEMSTSVFPGGKGGRCVRLTTLPPSCAVVMKSENLNFLEPSGPLQGCNGSALPFYLINSDGMWNLIDGIKGVFLSFELITVNIIINAVNHKYNDRPPWSNYENHNSGFIQFFYPEPQIRIFLYTA
jgi:hypothetical protein